MADRAPASVKNGICDGHINVIDTPAEFSSTICRMMGYGNNDLYAFELTFIRQEGDDAATVSAE